jgi:hypothetical protein
MPTGGGYAFRTGGPGADVELGPGPQLDAFGRLRTSQPFELFSKACEFDDQPLFYQNVLSGGAGASYSSSTTSTTLTVPAGGGAIRQSRWYIRYRPGKSQQIFITGNFGGVEPGVVKRMGLFDDNTQPGSTGDGVFFEVDDVQISAVLRSSATGVSVDTRYPQSTWNVDKLDGTGPSGVTLDLTKQQVVVIDFGWLGSAVVRWGFDIGGQILIVNEVFPANVLSLPFMSQPSLPLRWQVSSSGGAGSMQATCGAVQSEGGFNTLGVQRSISRAGAGLTLSATTLRPLLSIRLKDAYRRALLQPVSFSTISQGSSPENYEIQILVNATLTGATFAAGSASEIVNYDTAATAVSGGMLLESDYAGGGSRSTKSAPLSQPISSDVPISSNYAGVQDVLTLAVRPLGTASTTLFGSLVWSELY